MTTTNELAAREALAGVMLDAWNTEASDAIPHTSSAGRLLLADAILAAGFRRTPVPAPTEDARKVLIELWERHGSTIESDSSEGEELADAILARYNLVPVSPEGDEPATPVFEAMGLPPGTDRHAVKKLHRET